VSIQVFGILFLVGSSAVAFWVDARFPGIAPPNLRSALLRTLIAMALSRIAFQPVWGAALARSPAVVAVFLVAFPWLTWILLSAIWSIRLMQATLRRPY
jgi:hypothetical protein